MPYQGVFLYGLNFSSKKKPVHFQFRWAKWAESSPPSHDAWGLSLGRRQVGWLVSQVRGLWRKDSGCESQCIRMFGRWWLLLYLKSVKFKYALNLFIYLFIYLFLNVYWNVVDLQCHVSVWCTAKWFRYIFIYIISRIFSFTGYYKILSIGPCAIQ